MIVTLTKAEQAVIDEIEARYAKLIEDCEADIERLREDDLDEAREREIQAMRLPEPIELRPKPVSFDDGVPVYNSAEYQAYKETPEYQAYLASNEAANQAFDEWFSTWENAGSEAWKEARKRHIELIDELNQERKRFYRQAEQRQFSELKGDPIRIMADARNQMETLIKNRYDNAKKEQAEGKVFSTYYLRVDGDKLCIDSQKLLDDSADLLRLHYDFFKDDPEATKAIKAIVLDVIANNPHTGTTGVLGAYVNEHLRDKRTYRSRTKAREAGAIVEAPTALAIPTLPNYQYSMSLYQDGSAYLQPLSSTDGLKFKNGKMYFDGDAMQEVSQVELQNMKTKEGIEVIDLPVLRTLYSIMLTQFELSGYTVLQDVLTMSVPALAEFIGLQSNLNKKDVARVIEKMQSYHNIIGVLHGTRNGKPVQSLYPVLNFEGYNDKTNTISFSSPYMNYVIRTVYKLSLRKTKDGKKKLKKNGDPLRLPSHSYLIDSSIAKERNTAAVENVILIVTLIEQAGDNIPRIRASTLIERNVQLAERLETSKNPRALLKTTFTKTWELLRSKTKLEKAYVDIKLPEPDDPAYMPTMKTLNTVVFEFPHKGKIKQ